MLSPITDAGVLAFLEQKSTTPTGLTSAEIADQWTEDARYRAFFSARVAKADLLEGMRFRIAQVVEGQITPGQAKEWIREFLVTDGASSMRELGFLANDYDLNNANLITELGSARRISLIVDQNVRMAQSVGEWQRFNATADIFPYVRYKTREDSNVRLSHAALNNTTWRTGSPELAQIYPPNDFNCRCFVEQLTEDEAAGANISYTAPDGDELAPSGYRFNPALNLSANELAPKERWSEPIAAKYKEDLEHVAKTTTTGLPRLKSDPPSRRSGIWSAAKQAVVTAVMSWVGDWL